MGWMHRALSIRESAVSRIIDSLLHNYDPRKFERGTPAKVSNILISKGC